MQLCEVPHYISVMNVTERWDSESTEEYLEKIPLTALIVLMRVLSSKKSKETR